MIKYKPELILVISSDVSDQIGDYMDAVREEAKVPCEIVVCSLVSCEQDSVMTRRGFSIIRNALITQLLEILKPHHSNLKPKKDGQRTKSAGMLG